MLSLPILIFFFFKKPFFFPNWQCWVFIGTPGFSLVVASGCSGFVAWDSHCSGFTCCGAWALGCMGFSSAACGFQSAGSVVVVQGVSCSEACVIFLDQEQESVFPALAGDFKPLGSPLISFIKNVLAVSLENPYEFLYRFLFSKKKKKWLLGFWLGFMKSLDCIG